MLTGYRPEARTGGSEMKRTAVFFVLALVSFQASAQPVSEFDLLMDRGKKQVDQKNYARALEEFQAAAKAKPSSKGAVFNIAYCFMRMGRHEEAEAKFEAYIGMNPGDVKAGKAEHFLGQVREELSAIKARVRVESDPSGAQLYLDGDRAVEPLITPVSLWLRPDKHSIEAIFVGHRPRTELFEVKAGEQRTLKITLKPLNPDPISTPDPVPADPVAPLPLKVEETARSGGGDPWAYVTLGAGLSLLAGGTAVCLLAGEKFDDAEAHRIEGGMDQYNSGYDDARTQMYIGYGMLAAGGTAALSGLIWTIASSIAEPPATVGLAPSADGAYFLISTNF